MVSTGLSIFKSSCPCTNPLATVQSAPITIAITVSFMLLLLFPLERFSYQRQTMFSLGSPIDLKSPQVSTTLLRILAALNNAVVWMVSTRSLIFTFSSPSVNPLVTVPPSLSCSIVFFSSLARSWYLLLVTLSFSFTLWLAGTANSTIRQVLFFLLTITRSNRLTDI